MASSASNLLAFKDYEDFGESPQISVNSPKKVTFNGERFFHFTSRYISFKLKKNNYFR